MIKFQPGTEYVGADPATIITVLARNADTLTVRTWENYTLDIKAIQSGDDTTEYFTYKMRNFFAIYEK